MDNAVRDIKYESNVILCKEETYIAVERGKYMQEFEDFRADGKIISEFDDNKWVCNTGTRQCSIDFSVDEFLYKFHLGRVLKIETDNLVDMIKCFAIYICGSFTFRGIDMKVGEITKFLMQYGDAGYKAKKDIKDTILQFLTFIGLSEHEVDVYRRTMREIKRKTAKQRVLKHIITYMVIHDELDDVYKDPNLTDKEFVKWFPLYFWTHVTFVVPLRVTETMVTPFNCIECERNDDGSVNVWLTVRRSRLKKGMREVHYDVDKDYALFRELLYQNASEIPEVASVIMKYQKLTADKGHRFLFASIDGSDKHIHSHNWYKSLLVAFVEERIEDSTKYDYAKYASELVEFETPNIGDSRILALTNASYQGNSLDICRQLANHETNDASDWYCSNVKNTIEAASIMRIQKKIKKDGNILDAKEKEYREAILPEEVREVCVSTYRPMITGDVTDCVEQGRIGLDCIGCDYYNPSTEQLDYDLTHCRDSLDKSARALMSGLKAGPGGKGADPEKLALDIYTSAKRYSTIYDIEAEEKEKSWQRHRSTATT